jgi:hypothetical protein
MSQMRFRARARNNLATDKQAETTQSAAKQQTEDQAPARSTIPSNFAYITAAAEALSREHAANKAIVGEHAASSGVAVVATTTPSIAGGVRMQNQVREVPPKNLHMPKLQIR